MASRKTDNANLGAKLALRRHFLSKYHSAPPDVLDCCQGGGAIWTRLREEFPVATYWGLDVKPKKGRLKLDSVRVLQQPGWPQNVVDVDTYGSPWKYWAALLPNLVRPTTVFLTQGQLNNSLGREKAIMGRLNLPASTPAVIVSRFRNSDYGIWWMLTLAAKYATIIEAVECQSARTTTGSYARYLGIRLEPETNGRGAGTPGRSEQSEPGKEVQNV